MRCQGQLRPAGMGGVIGLDLPAALRMARALGYDEAAMAELLPYAERGMVTAINQRNRDGDQDPLDQAQRPGR